jgi:hypothetical protein
MFRHELPYLPFYFAYSKIAYHYLLLALFTHFTNIVTIASNTSNTMGYRESAKCFENPSQERDNNFLNPQTKISIYLHRSTYEITRLLLEYF